MESSVKNNNRTNYGKSPVKLMGYNKSSPSAVDLEKVLLGAIVIDSSCLINIIDILKVDIFYDDNHKKIFGAIESLFQKSEAIDIATVTHELIRRGELKEVGGAVYVSQLTNRIASTANVEVYARIVIERYLQRELIRISGDTYKSAHENSADVFELISKAEEDIFSISNETIKKTYEHISKVLSKSLAEIEAANNQEFSGVPSGFTSLDRITGGWHKSDLIILAARPGAGKTACGMTIARNAAVQFNKSIAVFSLEMPSTQLVNRLISSESEIDSDKLRQGGITEDQWQKIHKRIASLAEANIYIDDTPALPIFEFRAKAKRLKSQHNIDLIIIDYLQLMTTGSQNKFGNREQEVAMVSRTLKAIAKELDIPIIALAQMSRAVEQRGGDKRPQLSDLRDSGAIEMDADIVMFIYRPEMVGITDDENGNSTKGQAEIIIAKHRNGKIDSTTLLFEERFAKFADPSDRTSGFTNTNNREDEFANAQPKEKIEPNRNFMNEGPNGNMDDLEAGF